MGKEAAKEQKEKETEEGKKEEKNRE